MKDTRCTNKDGCFFVVNETTIIEVGFNLVLGTSDSTKVEVFNTLEDVRETYPYIEYENPLND